MVPVDPPGMLYFHASSYAVCILITPHCTHRIKFVCLVSKRDTHSQKKNGLAQSE